MRRDLAAFCSILTLSAAPAVVIAAPAEPVAGLWNGAIKTNGAEIPFRLSIAGSGQAVSAVFFDGDRKTNPSKSGSYVNGVLTLNFPSYNSQFVGRLNGGVLTGAYGQVGKPGLPIEARRTAPPKPAAGRAPAIGGDWIIPYKSPKGEDSWRLIVKQNGASAQASILRIDGDTGTLSGDYRDGAFRLSHFAGERPFLLEAKPRADGGLDLVLTDPNGQKKLQALRPAAARAQGVGAPTDPKTFTRVKDPAAPFRFSFPDLNNKLVSNTDTRFRGKVVVVNVMGSWCPNCHDEAPYLAQLYKSHKARGLEVVALDFEQPDQLQDPTRLKAFLARYGVTYPVLLAGEPKEAQAKLPQVVNFNAWPTTFIIGRDGKVRSVHVGFTSRGSGAHDKSRRADFKTEIEKLLAERG
jgi:thiol-disulfide isomerase/thioredoxin